MNGWDQPLVGSLALIMAGVAATVGAGPWERPYQLRSISTIDDRFGRPVARLAWFALAASLVAVGVAIISGWRPAYTAMVSQDSNGASLAPADPRWVSVRESDPARRWGSHAR